MAAKVQVRHARLDAGQPPAPLGPNVSSGERHWCGIDQRLQIADGRAPLLLCSSLLRVGRPYRLRGCAEVRFYPPRLGRSCTRDTYSFRSSLSSFPSSFPFLLLSPSS